MSAKRHLAEKLFDAYSTQLSALPQHGRGIPQVYDKFVCPLCTRVFHRSELRPEFLSVEHAIPEKFGGTLRTATLTCTACNTEGGGRIDEAFMRNIDNEDFMAGRSAEGRRVRLDMGGLSFNADLRIEAGEQKKLSFHLLSDGHDPETFGQFIKDVQEKADAGIHVPTGFSLNVRHDKQFTKIGLLRIAYLMMFREFGYTYVMQDTVRPIREQLLKPKETVVKDFFIQRLSSPLERTNVVTLARLPGDHMSFMVVLTLRRTDSKKKAAVAPKTRLHTFGVVMPSLLDSFETTCDRLKSAQGERSQSQIWWLLHKPEYVSDVGYVLRVYRLWHKFETQVMHQNRLEESMKLKEPIESDE